MEMLHRQYVSPFSEKTPAYNVVSYSASSSPSATSSFSDSQDDLLPDLWLEPNPPKPDFLAQLMLRDVSLEYAQLLLPHSLLAPLTEENLAAQQPLQCALPRPVQAAHPAHSHESHESHGSLQSREPRDPLALPESRRRGSHSSSGLNKGRNINTQLYKTELCVSFMKMGVCPYGAKCQFAHGEDDLKSVSRPANWRSKPCANWAKYGLCRYGKRCCFKHGH